MAAAAADLARIQQWLAARRLRRRLQQQLNQLVLQVTGQGHHLGNHWPGQVMEVLGHHDVGQLVVHDLRGLSMSSR